VTWFWQDCTASCCSDDSRPRGLEAAALNSLHTYRNSIHSLGMTIAAMQYQHNVSYSINKQCQPTNKQQFIFCNSKNTIRTLQTTAEGYQRSHTAQ